METHRFPPHGVFPIALNMEGEIKAIEMTAGLDPQCSCHSQRILFYCLPTYVRLNRDL